MSAESELFVKSLRESIRNGLRDINSTGNWLEEYEEWKSNELNQFDSLLQINNPFDLKEGLIRQEYDLSNSEDVTALDVICMSVFLSERLRKESKKVFSDVRIERNRNVKYKMIESYFDLVDAIIANENLATSIIPLNDHAEKQLVLFGNRSVDLYGRFFSLKECLGKQTTESLYLLYTYWRITKSRKNLKNLVNAISDYIHTYFYDYGNDPDMHLNYPLDGMTSIKKMDYIFHWLEYIAFHTNGVFEKYKDLEWIRPVDTLVDDIIETNQVSRFEMFSTKQLFPADDNDTVRKKAICNHGYSVWIKTVDVMYIVCDIYQTLYHFSDEELKKLNVTKDAILDGYDNMTKVRDFYSRKVFFHQVYFQIERKYFDSQVMEALEEDAEILSESINDAISFVNAITDDDIDSMLKSKQDYISRLSDFVSGEQEEALDELSQKIAEKIKASIQKSIVYDKMYSTISNDFRTYASTLMQYPNIFCSLVSAEYLYKQYVENADENMKFDYSCISIMYYISLEDFLNKLVYTPYANDILSGLDCNNPNNHSFWKGYVTNFPSYWTKDKKSHSYKLKTTCEIGVIGYLFEAVERKIHFKNYITSKYPKADTQRLSQLGANLKAIAPRRNEAAHGGNYITYSEVYNDKKYVYETSANAYKGLIKELLDIIL